MLSIFRDITFSGYILLYEFKFQNMSIIFYKNRDKLKFELSTSLFNIVTETVLSFLDIPILIIDKGKAVL